MITRFVTVLYCICTSFNSKDRKFFEKYYETLGGFHLNKFVTIHVYLIFITLLNLKK
ncbi:hypothetical protein C2G38_2104542 [Gigaspora rosea]|uniref:Uncharacterized protein n=1 Tax=Gigaspora rosea TaxID=44941 RepID=A0A397ULA5_9GLOM|nr:hypothetical protein C2G38_2104542 [Gigaspora rosea]